MKILKLRIKNFSNIIQPVISCTLTSNTSNFSVSPCERTWYHVRHSYELSISRYPLLSNLVKIISEKKNNNFASSIQIPLILKFRSKN